MIYDVNGSAINVSAALYIRLSKEDEDKKGSSESVTNQKSLLLQYVKENNLKVYDIYIDDGFSGTNFERPDFKRMISDIESKKINMVITKDMSRLGRDYIETGNLIEKYFPEHNVRYIAITDDIDTFLDSSQNDIAPFKAIMNDMYAKDVSKKIKSSFRAKQKEGKWISGRCPFGYDIDPNDRNHLIVNEKKAVVVRRIFDLCLKGLSFYKIAKILTNEKVKTLASYYKFEWKNNYNLNYNQWHSKTIRDILTNRIYIGDMVQNKRNKVNYKIKKIVKNNPRDYIVVESTHESIVDKNTFYEAQKRIPKNVGRNEKKEAHLLDGLLYCGDCGHRISVRSRRKKDNNCYTICNYYRTYIKQKLCTVHSNNYDKLESAILDNLRQVCLDYVNKKAIKNEVLKTSFNNLNDTEKELKILENDIKHINENLDNIYIDKLNKVITNEMFERVKVKLNEELNIKQTRHNEISNTVNNNIQAKEQTKIIENTMKDLLKFNNITREMIVNLIDRVEIYEGKEINLKLTFTVAY